MTVPSFFLFELQNILHCYKLFSYFLLFPLLPSVPHLHAIPLGSCPPPPPPQFLVEVLVAEEQLVNNTEQAIFKYKRRVKMGIKGSEK